MFGYPGLSIGAALVGVWPKVHIHALFKMVEITASTLRIVESQEVNIQILTLFFVFVCFKSNVSRIRLMV